MTSVSARTTAAQAAVTTGGVSCSPRSALAQAMTKGGRYQRPHTLTAGDRVCDMKWFADGPIEAETRKAGARRRRNRPLLVAATTGVGVFTGLLANGGGFLLVPLYLLVFGLRMRQAVGTSLVAFGVFFTVYRVVRG